MRTRTIATIAVTFIVMQSCTSGPRDLGGELRLVVEKCIEGFDGVVGVYVEHLPSGTKASVRGDEIFPTASMIKVPILYALYDRIARGELDSRASLTWSKSRIYPGTDLCAALEEGTEVSLRKLILLMESLSDNTASLWLQELAGSGTAINDLLAARGFVATRMNSRTPGREDDWKRFGWGQTTPREMATLMVRMRRGVDLPPALARDAYRALCRTAWDDTALEPIPLGVEVGSKQGAVDASRSEVFLVHAPHGEYVACVITKNQKDTSWGRDNAGFALLRRMSAALWHFFEVRR
ncbi:MAG: serine hydrolase [Planctomycetes bacterium]|nr:serine hydrolase [Planctomycetota bacterium]